MGRSCSRLGSLSPGAHGIVKGIMFNLTEEVVSAEDGDDSWDSLLDATQVEGAYAPVGGYPDDRGDDHCLLAVSFAR